MELIICIAILAIASIPIYQSMTVTIRTNAKAQSLQNATSLAETVMEEIKSTPIEDLMTSYPNASCVLEDGAFFAKSAVQKLQYLDTEHLTLGGDVFIVGNPGAEDLGATPPKYKMPYYIIYKHDKRATHSDETFDVLATLRTSTYMGADNDNASDANSKKLPKIEEVDELTQAVISQKEMNKFDDAASDFFKQNIADYADHAEDVKVTQKKIVIEKKNTGDIDLPVKVNCKVVYEDNHGNTYSKELFSSSFGYTEKVEDGSTKKQPLSSNIYIYYKRALAPPSESGTSNEFIEITDTAPGTHKVFLVMQNPNAITGTTVTVNNGGVSDVITLSSNTQLDDDGNLYSADKKYELITNMKKDGSDSGHIYNNESRIRIYDVNVTLLKDGEVYATLDSTKETNDKK